MVDRYAFVDVKGTHACVAASQLAYQGQWTSGGTYSRYQVTSGTLPRTGNYMALFTVTGTPLPDGTTTNGTWSLLTPYGT